MMEYNFSGTVKVNKNDQIPFQIINGIVIFGMWTKTILPYNERHVILNGITDRKFSITFLVDYFYECDFEYTSNASREKTRFPHIEGLIEACFVMETGSIEDVDSLGFYSLAIPKITGHMITGALNDENSSWLGIKNEFGNYTHKNHKYRLSIGFLNNEPFYSGQLLEIKRDCKFNINSIIDSYWIVKKLFMFLFQKRNVPIDSVYLRINEKNIGQLFIESLERSETFFCGIKCIQTNILGNKINNLLQLIADQKIYLRHVPMFKEEEKLYTPARLLMALVGLENTLDLINVHVIHSGKHIITIESVKLSINKLVDSSTGDEKKIYKRFLNQLQKDENFESRILVSLNENRNNIGNFFPIYALGDNPSIAKDLSNLRNDLAHGNLNIPADLKTNYQMNFLMVYILYLQLKMIGFKNDEACEIVPHILFSH